MVGTTNKRDQFQANGGAYCHLPRCAPKQSIKRNRKSWASSIRGYLGASAYLCRMLAFTHTELWSSAEYLRGVACINRKRGAKPAEESASMGLLAW
jgi:hypothetical protein